MERSTRKNSAPIKVYCLPGERLQIEANAQAAGLSLSTYQRGQFCRLLVKRCRQLRAHGFRLSPFRIPAGLCRTQAGFACSCAALQMALKPSWLSFCMASGIAAADVLAV